MGSKSARRRLGRARVRRREIGSINAHLRAGNITLYELLEAPPSCLGNVRVCDVLRHAKGLRDAGVDKVLQKAEVWPLTKMKDLLQEDRLLIQECLPERVPKSSPKGSQLLREKSGR